MDNSYFATRIISEIHKSKLQEYLGSDKRDFSFVYIGNITNMEEYCYPKSKEYDLYEDGRWIELDVFQISPVIFSK